MADSPEVPRYPSVTAVSDALGFDASVAPCPLDAAFVTVSSGFAPKLTTHHQRWFEAEALETPHGPESFTRDLPNVGEEALQGLDERGVVVVGTAVTPGALLVGRISPRGDAPLSPEEKLLRAIFGEKAGDVVDRSLRAPGGCFGAVTAVELEGKRARVQVSWTRPLEVGDVLELDGHLAVVAALQEQGADLACQGVAARVRVKKQAIARDLMHARCIGPYDLDTQLPLVGKEQFGGQVVGPELAAVLGAHAPWLLWELFTLKSDSVNARTRAYESIVKQQNPAKDLALPPSEPAPPPVPPTTAGRALFDFFEKPDRLEPPEAVVRISAWLRALGLEVDLKADAPGVEVLTAEGIVRLSRGRVEAGGLFSQKLFGPLRDYECECGKYKRMKHRGVVCEKCGVDVVQSKTRRERFGHLELPAPCVSPMFPEGEPLSVLPVIPPGLRPEPSTLNALYERVLEATSPGEVQAGVDALFSTLTALVDEVWRSNVFVKSVDSSGAAHLTVDPSLPKGTCRVPRPMLTELFKPFVYGVLEQKGLVTTIKSAKRMVASERPEAMKAVDLVSAGYPLLLACGAKVVSRCALAWDEPAIAVDVETARLLGERTVCVHLPVTTQAVLEVARLADLPAANVPAPRGWLSEAKRDGALLAAALRGAKSGEHEHLADPVLLCALGRPPPSPPLAELEAWESEQRLREADAVLAEPQPAAEQARQHPEAFARSLDELELSVMTANALAKLGLRTVGELCQRTESDLLKGDGFGRKSLKEVKELLAGLGLSLGMRG